MQAKKLMIAAIIGLTFCLALLNMTGAWLATGGTFEPLPWLGWKVIPVGGNAWWTGAIGFIEVGLAVALVLTMTTPTRMRFGFAVLIFVGMIFVTTENGKFAVKFAFSDLFTGTVEELESKKALAEEDVTYYQAKALEDERNKRDDIDRQRTLIAEIKAERDLMVSNTRIEEAQRRLCALDLYPCNLIDGVRAEITLGAMAQRAETLRIDQEREQNKLDLLEQPAQDPEVNEDGTLMLLTNEQKARHARLEVVRFQKERDTVDYRNKWMHAVLYTFEGIRAFGVWAFISTSTRSGTLGGLDADLRGRREDDIELEEKEDDGGSNNETGPGDGVEDDGSVREGDADGVPEPVSADADDQADRADDVSEHNHSSDVENDDEPETPPEDPATETSGQDRDEMTDQQRAASKGGRSTAHKKRVRKSRLVRVADYQEIDRLRAAAE